MSDCFVRSVDVYAGVPPEAFRGCQSFKVHFYDFGKLNSPKGDVVKSPRFECFNHEWLVEMYSRGIGHAKDGMTSVYLRHLSDNEITVSFDITVKGDEEEIIEWKGGFVSSRASSHAQFIGARSLGWSNFATRSSLLEEPENLNHGTLVLEIRMKLDQTKSPSLPGKEDEEKEDEEQGNETEVKEPRIVADKAVSIEELDIEIGSVLPDFTLTCVDGEKHKLSDFRGTKVMLCFYRFVYCPYCAYTISKIIGAYKKLAWASKLKVVFVFRTDLAFLKQGLTSDDAPIPRLSPDKDRYPFLALADEDGEVGKTYQIKSKSLLAHGADLWRDLPILRNVMGSVCNIGSITMLREELKFPMTPSMLPSELLIDEEGILVDIYRSENSLETMAMDRVTQFLLFGANIPSSKDVRNTLNQKRDPRRRRDTM